MFDLDESQQLAWELYLTKKNVAVFGRAGCGKSTVMLRAIAHARRMHGGEHVGDLAWTNRAASLIGGQTICKFLRVGGAALSKEDVLATVKGNAAAKAHIARVRVIFIDELSLVVARWFGVLEYVVRQLAVPCMQALPWGGCQVVSTLLGLCLLLSLRDKRE